LGTIGDAQWQGGAIGPDCGHFLPEKCPDRLGYGFDDSFVRVMAKYLDAGDTRPLLDLLRHKREPGEIAIKYLAAMMVTELRARLPLTKIQYKFHFAQNRKVGPPKRDEQATRIAQALGIIIVAGLDAMAEGKKPDKSFWKWFRYALEPGDFELIRIDGRKGRRKNPELNMQRKLLAQMVEKRIDRGDGYESAIQDTHDEIKKLAKDEGWRGNIGVTTIRNAFDKFRLS
jgi:hypothetical protein